MHYPREIFFVNSNLYNIALFYILYFIFYILYFINMPITIKVIIDTNSFIKSQQVSDFLYTTTIEIIYIKHKVENVFVLLIIDSSLSSMD